MNEFPQIFTFYSFKGGVGRSMAVLNMAYALAGRGRNVLVLDMDLEAPGLSGFLRRSDEIGACARQDMVDLVRWAKECSETLRQTSRQLDPAAFPPLGDFAVSVPPEKLEAVARNYGPAGRVDFIPVDDERDYYGRWTALAINTFDREALIRVGSLLRSWIKSRVFAVDVPEYYGPEIERTAKYDYVLVDSRTGVTETGGLCIGPLSDQLVVFTALNDQNVVGTRRFLEEVGVLKRQPATPSPSDTTAEQPERLESKPTLIVASPVPAGEIETKQRRLKELELAIGKVAVKLSYHPQMALLESIFVRDFPDEYLAKEYETLLECVLRAAQDGMATEFLPDLPGLLRAQPDKWRPIVSQALRAAATFGGQFLWVVLPLIDLETVERDEDFALLDRAFRVVCEGGRLHATGAPFKWASLLGRWSHHTKDPRLTSLRHDAEIGRYNGVLASGDASVAQKAMALCNRGVAYGEWGDSEKEIADFDAVLQMPDAPAEQRAQAVFNRGVAYEKRGEAENAISDYNAVLQMHDAPDEQKVAALVNRGWSHYLAGRQSDAINDYRQALSLDANDRTARGNLAVAMLVDGQTEDALAAYDSAIEIADREALEEMTDDLRKALEDHPGLVGAEQALGRVEARRAQLRA